MKTMKLRYEGLHICISSLGGILSTPKQNDLIPQTMNDLYGTRC